MLRGIKMFCKKCGKEIFDNSDYCEECRNTVQKNEPAKRRKCCPKCKSHNLQIVTNTEYSSQTKGGGYSAGKGCCGYMLAGPLGLLCGACGSKSQTTVTSKSTTVWTCLDCGNKFRDIADIEKDIEATTKGAKVTPIMCYATSALMFIPVPLYVFYIMRLSSLGASPNSAGVMSLLVSVISGVVFIMLGKWCKQRSNERLYSLNEEKKEIEKNGYTNE